MLHTRDKVDTSIRHVGANLGHDKWIQVLSAGSIFTLHPLSVGRSWARPAPGG